MNTFSDRKTPRASWHQYADGIYFLTVVTKDRKHYLGEIQDQVMHYSTIGQRLANIIETLESYYPWVRVFEYVVMPNHFHLLVGINLANAPTSSRDINKLPQIDSHTLPEKFFSQVSAANGAVSKLIRNIKSLTTTFAHSLNLEFAWQERYHDRIVRNWKEEMKIAAYIQSNIANWQEDCFHPDNNVGDGTTATR